MNVEYIRLPLDSEESDRLLLAPYDEVEASPAGAGAPRVTDLRLPVHTIARSVALVFTLVMAITLTASRVVPGPVLYWLIVTCACLVLAVDLCRHNLAVRATCGRCQHPVRASIPGLGRVVAVADLLLAALLMTCSIIALVRYRGWGRRPAQQVGGIFGIFAAVIHMLLLLSSLSNRHVSVYISHDNGHRTDGVPGDTPGGPAVYISHDNGHRTDGVHGNTPGSPTAAGDLETHGASSGKGAISI